jgi:DNA polymerase-1
VFRLIYGGTAYSYANDADFTGVSRKESFWQGVIDEFYAKYAGLAKWHTALMQEASTTGMLRMPTGRVFKYHPEQRRGDVVWPRTTILNYPVQGSGADIMCIARVSFARRFKAAGILGLLVSTVHDSIVVDVADHEVDRTCQLFHDVFDDIPLNLKKIFNIDFPIPTRCEVDYGPTLKDTTTWIPKA